MLLRLYGVAVVLVSLVGSSATQNDQIPLRGYTCKKENVAQQPCSLCPSGYYCTDEYMPPQHCGGPEVYCPIGSVQPTPVSDGYFSIDGDNDTAGAQEICPASFYCTSGVKVECPAGWFCPTMGLSAPIECGDSTVFCPESSWNPIQVKKGFYTVGGTNATRTGQIIAPPGHYASDGILKECAEGHYSYLEGMDNDRCMGICEAGFYCPSASVSSRQIKCGGEDLYCPPGSAKPHVVQDGYYTSTEEEGCRPGTYRQPILDTDVDESYITTSRDKGICVRCPENTYKHFAGDGHIDYCEKCGPKAKSTTERISCECHQSATDKAKGHKVYFDPIYATCSKLADGLEQPPDDSFAPETQLTKTREHKCEKGHYCQEGIRYRCRGGRFGDKDLETNEDCSGPCDPGHWCGEASTTATENKCGDTDVYCPTESSSPVYVSKGHYTNEGEPDDMRSSQLLCEPGYYCQDGLRMPCEAGHFGASPGLSVKECDGQCSAGFYCPTGSVGSTQVPCGNSTVYCPEGSKIPLLVEEGYYSAQENDINVADMYAGPNSTQNIQLQCEKGYYCTGGVKYSCPAGTYGVYEGARHVSECFPCRPGFYCPSHPSIPTTEENQVPCGDASVYCPRGSSEPQAVELGYYGEVPEENQASSSSSYQVICEPGFKCQNGIREPCRAGTFGETSGLYADDCSGLCPRGFFCPTNSIDPLPCSPGAYSTGGASDCTFCEIPYDVPMEVIHSICRDDRSCCLEVFD